MNNSMEKEVFDIYVDDIIPNRFQPRLTFDEKSLQELADSIKQHGIIQPLVVRKVGDKYEIIAGERRYKAAQIAGLQKVPAIIMNLDDKESAEVAVVENIQRRDLSALEEAESYKKLLDRGYLTQEQLAGRMGKAQATVSNKLRLLGLPDEVKNALLNDKISERHARSLLSLKNPNEQVDVLNKIIDNKMTVRQTDELIKTMTEKEPVSTGNIETLDFQEGTDNNQKEMVEDIKPIPEMAVPPIENPNTDAFIPIPELPKTEFSPIAELPQNEFNPISNIDVNQIKNEAVDINPVKPLADIDSLLGGKEETVAPEAAPIPSYRFIPSVFGEEPEDDKPVMAQNVGPVENQATPNNIEPRTYTDSLVQEFRQSNGIIPKEKSIVAGDLRSAINAVRDLTQSLEANGFKADIEEFDFEHLYQIIIKIDK